MKFEIFALKSRAILKTSHQTRVSCYKNYSNGLDEI